MSNFDDSSCPCLHMKNHYQRKGWEASEQTEEKDDVDVVVSFNCKSKLVLILRLGYLKLFLAGSMKTKHGPGWKVGTLCISRCWFYLTVVAVPKQIKKITKSYGVVFSCVMVLIMTSWFRYLWWNDRCLWNDYTNGRIMHWWISCWLLKVKK